MNIGDSNVIFMNEYSFLSNRNPPGLSRKIISGKIRSNHIQFQIVRESILTGAIRVYPVYREIQTDELSFMIKKCRGSWKKKSPLVRCNVIFCQISVDEKVNLCKYINSVDCHVIFRECGGIPKDNIQFIEGGTRKTVLKIPLEFRDHT